VGPAGSHEKCTIIQAPRPLQPVLGGEPRALKRRPWKREPCNTTCLRLGADCTDGLKGCDGEYDQCTTPRRGPGRVG
jgi:hypothetical protein